MEKLYNWKECSEFGISDVYDLYAKYVNEGQVSLISSFGFGRDLAVKSEGMYIYTQSGAKILDMSGGVGVLNHGHNHPRILQVRKEFQELHKMEVHKNFLSPYIAGLSYNIASLMPQDLDICYFCNSGAESVEGAVKMAYKYHSGKRNVILHADISFHGKLLGSAGLTGSPELHFKFPTIPGIDSFKYNDIDSLKDTLSKYDQNGESDVYAIIIEPMNGSSLRECSTDFLQELRKICTEKNIVLIFDEVYTGWGKTGELFYFFKHDVVPDICTTAKSLGGGKSSIAGYVARRPIFNGAYGNLNDCILHSTTYNGFGEECATAIEAINVLIEENLVERSKEIHNKLNSELKRLQEKYPDIIQEVRGSGALNGLILNQEISKTLRLSLNFMPGELFKDTRFMAKLITGAVISELYNTHSILTFFGSNTEIPLIISPSLVAKDEDLDYFIEALDKTLAVGKFKLILKFATYKFLKKSL